MFNFCYFQIGNSELLKSDQICYGGPPNTCYVIASPPSLSPRQSHLPVPVSPARRNVQSQQQSSCSRLSMPVVVPSTSGGCADSDSSSTEKQNLYLRVWLITLFFGKRKKKILGLFKYFYYMRGIVMIIVTIENFFQWLHAFINQNGFNY